MKYCAMCNIQKPYEQFNRASRKYGDGYNSYCRSCASHYYFNKKRTEVIRSHIQRDSKVCINCNKEKDITEFGKKIANRDGRNDYCKICWSMNIRDGLD